ncbi:MULTISPECIES: TRAP transporter substrate-binding protein [unclassified Vibrio]|uniref:TRAP transporter substrate-binding protein n=1 Tax=Vibrio sp. HB236076 TaxID=3232307 RepID=A0AB39HJZ5_9VIBR|nr:TRAP transporter substrate-binding protein [Vibrio sp. HB161653]MDP5252859.1 TRAP transporter substrate-binding protein [Vibrio sp. HB161653]
MQKKKFFKAISLATCLMMSASAFSATWKIAVGDGGGSAQEELGKKFSEVLAEKTDNKFKTEIFVNGQLGSEQATVNDVSLGILDMSILGSNNLAPFSPSIGILSLPYIFENIDQAETIINSDIEKSLAETVLKEANVRIIAWSYSGFRMLTNSKRPVKNLDDLQGLFIRVPKSDLIIKTYQSLGINPTPVAWSETFTALQQKVVDGQETPYAAIHSMKFAEIQKYLTETHYLFQLEPLIMSESVFQDQSEDVQKAILEAGEAATEHSLAWIKSQEASIKEELVAKYGLEIDQLEDEAEWVKRAQKGVWPEFYEQVGGKDKINELLRTLGREEI